MTGKMTLADVAAGDTAVIVGVEGGKALTDRLKALGIRRGTKLTKVSNSFARGPVVVRHGQAQTALGSGICAKILVEIAS
jgi:Fe2+ transport system protein FeoA